MPRTKRSDRRVSSRKTKIHQKDHGAKRPSRLLFIPLIVAPCAIFGPIIEGASEGWSPRLFFPIGVFVYWLVVSAWSFGLKRNIFDDLSPFLVFPIGILNRGRQGVAGAGKAGSWGKRMATQDFKEQAPVHADRFIPRKFDTVSEHGRVMALLARGKVAVMARNQRRVIYLDFKDAKHLLIQGTTGTGKTTIALTILMSMLLPGPSVFTKWRFYLHDAKHVIGTWFLPVQAMFPEYFSVQMKFDGALAQAEELVEEMQRRLEMIGEGGMEPEDVGLGRICFVSDEPQVFYDKKLYPDGPRYEAAIKHLVNLGRQAGIHVILITPYALADVISTQYRGNLRIITGFMKKNTIASHGIPGVTKLREFEFLYEEQPTQEEVFCQTYAISKADLAPILDKLGDEAAHTPAELMLHIFAGTKNCGYRKIYKIGLERCQIMLDKGEIEAIPAPWSEIEMVEGEAKPSRAAAATVKALMDQFIEAGIAEDAGTGKARKFIAGDYATALTLWRKYKAKN